MNSNIKRQLEKSIEELKIGKSIEIDGLAIGLGRNKNNFKELTRLRVIEFILYDEFNTISGKDIPKSIFKPRLNKIKEKFNEFLEESEVFKDFAIKAGIDYYLNLDYQSGSVILCCEEHGEYKEYF